MRDLNELTITDAVLRKVGGATDPRIRFVTMALVRHLHEFLREVRPSQEEWMAGIEFLTRTGHLCSDKRQEFILLSDTLGVSMLVDAINNSLSEGATQTTVLGPFYVQGPPEFPLGSDISNGVQGDPLYVSGSVLCLDGKPVQGAAVDVWHSDQDGYYNGGF